jgi:hypothetical protein
MACQGCARRREKLMAMKNKVVKRLLPSKAPKAPPQKP